jgi:hypothetical protein
MNTSSPAVVGFGVAMLSTNAVNALVASPAGSAWAM